MEGTRMAVLDDICQWARKGFELESSPTEINNVYWLYGIPGIGKTSVANSICGRLHESKNLGGSYFCRRDDPLLGEPKYVMPTLIHRLSSMWGPYRKLVVRALRDDPHLGVDSTRLLFSELLLKPIISLKKRHPPRPLVLVVDALDECGDSFTRRSLLIGLLEASSHVPWLKVIITSRQEHDIDSFFQQVKPRNRYLSRDLSMDDEKREDVRFLAQERMLDIAQRCHLRHDWPGKERLDLIVERCGGLFIFVETMWRFLRGFKDPEGPLKQVLTGDSAKANSELDKLYIIAISSRLGEERGAFRAIAGAVVAVAPYRPLCDETLATLTGLEPRVVTSWVDSLSSLLYRESDKSGGVRVRHLSILEFLTGKICPDEFRVDIQQANASMALSCLRTMIRELKFNICELETSCLSNADVEDLKDRVKRKISDGLQYSCLNWCGHLAAIRYQPNGEAIERLKEFLGGERLLFWMEVLSLMGKMPAAPSAMRQLAGWITVSTCPFMLGSI